MPVERIDYYSEEDYRNAQEEEERAREQYEYEQEIAAREQVEFEAAYEADMEQQK